LKAIAINCQGAGTVAWQHLRPFQGDLKKLSIENYERLRDEILRDGFCEPISVWQREFNDGTGTGIAWTILNGHQRLATIREMVEVEGYTCPPIPVSIVQCRDEAQANDLVLALTSQYGQMTEESLAAFIQKRGLDVKTVVQRYRQPEIDVKRLVKICEQPVRVEEGNGQGNADPEAVPEPPKEARTKRGDLYRLGDHYLICGDATNEADLDRLCNGEVIDLVFTDPPYGVSATGGRRQMGLKPILNDDLRGNELAGFIVEALANCNRVLKAGGSAYVCYDQKTQVEFGTAIRTIPWKQRSTIVWNKNLFGLSGKGYRPKFELIAFCHSGDGYDWFGDQAQADVWDIARPNAQDRPGNHPTPKPVDLVERALVNSSQERMLVLDVFAGSGSTLIACEKTGRFGRAIELDPVYCDVIVERWEKFTGRKAELVEM
jgi:DNA modification methylase